MCPGSEYVPSNAGQILNCIAVRQDLYAVVYTTRQLPIREVLSLHTNTLHRANNRNQVGFTLPTCIRSDYWKR